MTYVKKIDDNGNVYVEDGNYWTYSDKYEYEEQADKQVTVELTVNAGETKTDFIEVKVKDLDNKEESKVTNINYAIQINNLETKTFNIKNVIKQAEIEVTTKILFSHIDKRSFQYIITINNLTDRELKNVKIKLDACDKIEFSEVFLSEGGVEDGLSGNTWTYTIDSLKHNEEKEADAKFNLTGKVDDSIYNIE